MDLLQARSPRRTDSPRSDCKALSGVSDWVDEYGFHPRKGFWSAGRIPDQFGIGRPISLILVRAAVVKQGLFGLAALITRSPHRVAHDLVGRAAGFRTHQLSSQGTRDLRSSRRRRPRRRGGPGVFFTLVKNPRVKNTRGSNFAPLHLAAPLLPRGPAGGQVISLALRCVRGCGVLVDEQQACRAEHAPRTGFR